MRFMGRKADAEDAVAVLERNPHSLCMFLSQYATPVGVIHDKGQGGRMSQHVFHWCIIRANKAKTQVGCRCEDERSPSPADVRELDHQRSRPHSPPSRM